MGCEKRTRKRLCAHVLLPDSTQVVHKVLRGGPSFLVKAWHGELALNLLFCAFVLIDAPFSACHHLAAEVGVDDLEGVEPSLTERNVEVDLLTLRYVTSASSRCDFKCLSMAFWW
jgi:hypothetical protein